MKSDLGKDIQDKEDLQRMKSDLGLGGFHRIMSRLEYLG